MKITVPIEAKPKERPRKGKYGMYTPRTTSKLEDTIRYFASKEIDKPLEGAVSITIKFYIKRPKRLIWKKKPMSPMLCDKRPDIDNYIKLVTDALNGLAYRDDGQIAIIHAEKWYCGGGDFPRIDIVISSPEILI